jgi:hypothetical protein
MPAGRRNLLCEAPRVHATLETATLAAMAMQTAVTAAGMGDTAVAMATSAWAWPRWRWVRWPAALSPIKRTMLTVRAAVAKLIACGPIDLTIRRAERILAMTASVIAAHNLPLRRGDDFFRISRTAANLVSAQKVSS